MEPVSTPGNACGVNDGAAAVALVLGVFLLVYAITFGLGLAGLGGFVFVTFLLAGTLLFAMALSRAAPQDLFDRGRV